MITTRRALRRTTGALQTNRDDGQSLVEYTLIVLLIAIATIAVLGGFGGAVNVLYQYILAGLPF